LPILFAGNPVNYSKATKLSTVEALAGALYIAGFKEDAKKLLSVFVWGHTFLELNANLLENYAAARDSAEIVRMQSKIEGIEKKSDE
jgi:pre-rRNA-processing protein TSR3